MMESRGRVSAGKGGWTWMGGSGVGAATERVSAEGAVWPRHWGERAQKGAGDKVRASTTRGW
jgi:hypothetical protein